MSKKLALPVVVKEASSQKIHLQSNENFRSIRLLGFLFSGFLLLGVTIFILAFRLELYSGLVILLLVPALIIAFTALRPSDHRVLIDLDQNALTHEIEYRFGLPFISELDREVYALSSFTEIKKEKNTYTDSYALLLEAPGVSRMRLNLSQGKKAAQRVYRILGLEEGLVEQAANAPILDAGIEIELEDFEWNPLDAEVVSMKAQLASWTRGLLFLAIIHFFASGVLDFTWGIILILVAIGSAIFRHPAMFVVHASTLGYVGLSNIFSAGLGPWTLFGIYQIYLAYRTYSQFRQYKDVPARYMEDGEAAQTDGISFERTKQFFPWLSVIFGSLGLSTYCFVILVAFVMAVLNNGGAPMSDLLANIFSAQFNLGLLGLATGTAALLSGFPRKVLSWVGLGLGVLWFILNAVLILTG